MNNQKNSASEEKYLENITFTKSIDLVQCHEEPR